MAKDLQNYLAHDIQQPISKLNTDSELRFNKFNTKSWIESAKLTLFSVQ